MTMSDGTTNAEGYRFEGVSARREAIATLSEYDIDELQSIELKIVTTAEGQE